MRVSIISQSEAVAQDGLYFLVMTKIFQTDPSSAMKRYPVHPGYPLSVLGVYELMDGSDGGDQQDAWPRWERAGQVVAFAASLVMLLGVWAFAAMVFENRHVAFWAAMLFGFGRKFATLGTDVMSDPLMLCFQIWTVVVAVGMLRRLDRRSAWTLVCAGGVGLLSAAAYLVRPEGIVVLPAAWLLWIFITIRRRRGWGLMLTSLVVSAVVAVLCMLPYMLAIGGLTAKWQWKEFGLPVLGGLSSYSALATIYPVEYLWPVRVIGRFFEAQQPVLASLTAAYLALWLVGRLKRAEVIRQALLRLSTAGGFVIVVLWLLIIPPLVMRYQATGAMSHRYLMLPAAMMAGLPVAAVLTLINLAIRKLDPLRRARKAPWILAGVGTILAAVLIVHGLRPLHENQVHLRRAGLWLAAHAQPGDSLMTDQIVIRYYCGMPGSVLDDQIVFQYYYSQQGNVPADVKEASFRYRDLDKTRQDIIRQLLIESDSVFTYVAIAGPVEVKNVPELATIFQEAGYERIKTFPRIKKGKPRADKAVHIFRKSAIAPAPPEK